ncbi:MAG TPA: hypothetical protein VMX13_18480 [Sedimentisphaerales bacterium]|nr:hypothetical protein [Sedimentisphaerales bacterium]
MMLSMRYYLAICMALCLWLDVDALGQDGLEVLRNLKNYDSIYEAGFTVSGTRKCPEHLILGQVIINVERKWRLAFEGGRCAYLMEIVEYEKPKFMDPKGRDRGSLTQDGWLMLSLHTRQWGYWGADVSGNHYEDTTIKVSPDNQVVEVGGNIHNSLLFDPKDAGPNAPKCAILWSLGRFFSKLIDEVTLVKESSDGRITVSALGRKEEGEHGRWELEIEPAPAWMVREARFYSDAKPDVISCEMKNSGTVWSGSYCIPGNAVFNYGGPIKDARVRGDVEELTFDPVIEQFDEKVYEGARQAVTKDRPPKLTIHDFRVSPMLVYQPDELAERALDIASDSISESTPPEDKLVDANKAVAKAENEGTRTSGPNVSATRPSTSPSTGPSVQSAPVSPVPQRPWYLLPAEWSVAVLILAVLTAGCACFFLFRSQKS